MTAPSESKFSAPQLELMKAWSEYLVDSAFMSSSWGVLTFESLVVVISVALAGRCTLTRRPSRYKNKGRALHLRA